LEEEEQPKPVIFKLLFHSMTVYVLTCVGNVSQNVTTVLQQTVFYFENTSKLLYVIKL